MNPFGLRHRVKPGFSEGQACGKYVLERVLGEGGMGVVWQAWDPRSSRHVAIKVVAEDLLMDSGIEARFRDEVRRHAALNHPNIVKLLDTFSLDNQQCMVMALVPGESVAARLRRTAGQVLPLEFSIGIFTDILSALDYAHRHGIWHRDVKPSNILLDAKHRAYLADFGIAIAVGEARLTRAGVAVGTAEYMSPEQIRSPQDVDHRTDVYSAGCVLYEMLTGRPPFIFPELPRATADVAIRSAHLNEAPVPPQQRQPAIPAAISDVIMSALSKDPNHRPQGCAEFSRLLSATASPPPQAPEKGSAAALPLKSLAIFGLVALAVGIILYIAWV
jgi:serine/threonine-protein kinase